MNKNTKNILLVVGIVAVVYFLFINKTVFLGAVIPGDSCMPMLTTQGVIQSQTRSAELGTFGTTIMNTDRNYGTNLLGLGWRYVAPAPGTAEKQMFIADQGTNQTHTKSLFITGFGFNIPSDAVITGVQFETYRVIGTDLVSGKDGVTMLQLKSGTSYLSYGINSPKDATDTFDELISATEAKTVYGGSNDLWGSDTQINRTLTPAVVNDVGFGIKVAYDVVNRTFIMPSMRIEKPVLTIYYTVSGQSINASCGSNIGACKTGVSTCTYNTTSKTAFWGACVGKVIPSAEVCNNGIDEDCDGTADDGCLQNQTNQTPTGNQTPFIGQGTGLRGDYYNEKNLSVFVLSQIDSTVNKAWYNNLTPNISIEPFNWAIRWTGQVQAKYTDTYYFGATSDDGVRVYVNNQLLVDVWKDQPGTNYNSTTGINMLSGEKYNITVEYYQGYGAAVIKLYWFSSKNPYEIIPMSQLYPAQSTQSAPICGNGVIEYGEVCEGTSLNGKTCQTQGFLSGTLRCSSNCKTFNTTQCIKSVCGDSIISGSELCDNQSLGGKTCTTEGYDAGQLKCLPNCQGVDTSICTKEDDPLKEDCFSNWNCTAWSGCSNNQQTRTCEDTKACPTPNNIPVSSITCEPTATDNAKIYWVIGAIAAIGIYLVVANRKKR